MSNESLLLAPDTRVTCPKCEHEFSLEQGFAKQALETAEAASSNALAGYREEGRVLAEREAALIAREQAAAHEKTVAQVRRLAEESLKPQMEALHAQLADREAKLAVLDQREAALVVREKGIESRVAEAAARKAAELVAGERQAHLQQLAEREKQLAESRAAEVALRREKAAVEDRAAALEVEVARKLDAGRAEIEAKAKAQEQERSGLEKAELQKTIEDMKGKLAEAQQKADQGSQQLQGEVLELALEEGLRRTCPLDTIEEVKKGARGGDVIQRVVSRTGQAAGTVLWESKRAKDFGPAWTAKLKEDMRAAGADIGVLVTMPAALPRDWPAGQYFGIYDEVWVTVWSTALQLAEVLRAMLLEVHKQRLVSAGKEEKTDAVYTYVTSAQFAQKLQAVYGAFKKMREELESEKSVTVQRWARREKQLQGGAMQLLGIGGDLQGLAQLEGPALELEYSAPTDDEP